MVLALKVRKGGFWRRFDRCRLGISVGQRYHEGHELELLLRWVADRFDKCHILLGDTLQRFNYPEMLAGDPERARLKARLAGDAWLRRNLGRIEELTIPFEISRWDDWLNDTRYKANFELVSAVFSSNQTFRDSVYWDATDYLRRGDTQEGLSSKRVELCTQYIIEELSVTAIMNSKEQFVDVYPGSELATDRLIREKRFPGLPKSLFDTKYTEVRIRDDGKDETEPVDRVKGGLVALPTKI